MTGSVGEKDRGCIKFRRIDVANYFCDVVTRTTRQDVDNGRDGKIILMNKLIIKHFFYITMHLRV